MDYLRIAAVQLEYIPLTKGASMNWKLGEPLAPVDPWEDSPKTEYLLTTLKSLPNCREVCERALRDSKQSYLKNLEEKIKEVLDFCLQNAVDLVVLPEYSVPVELIGALRRFSTRMTIVAGMGCMQRSDIDSLKSANITNLEQIQVGNNIALLLSPNLNIAVSKKNPAQGEDITIGTGPLINSIQTSKGEFNIGLGICLDFLREQTTFYDQKTDIALIPALSRNISEFVEETPRDFIRIFVNHATYGGTYFGLPSITKNLGFTDKNGTIPLAKGEEGIIIIDWDHENPFQTKPSKTSPPAHRIHSIANIIYSGIDRELAEQQRRLVAIASERIIRADDLLEQVALLRSNPSLKRYELTKSSLDILAESPDAFTDDEIRILSRNCILSEPILSLTEWRYQQCATVAQQLRRLQDIVAEPDSLAVQYAIYEKTAREARNSGSVRQNLLFSRHKVAMISGNISPNTDLQLVFYARLGPYGEGAVKTLPRQLMMLRAIADLQDRNLQLKYRLYTSPDEAGAMQARYEVSCVTRGRTQDELEELREGLGQVMHLAFTGGYSIYYTTGKEAPTELNKAIESKPKWQAELRLFGSRSGSRKQFLGVPDWPLIIDLLRSLKLPAELELQCAALPSIEKEVKSEVLGTVSRMNLMFDAVTQSNRDVGPFFVDLIKREWNDRRQLSLRVFIGSNEPLPPSILHAIGNEIAGMGIFEVIESQQDNVLSSQIELTNKNGQTPAQTLIVFHPPFGQMFRTTGHRRTSLNIPTDEGSFPLGITLGKAKIRQIRGDEEIDVRLSEEDRLRHTYILGRTGTGKTNLLKMMAAQDVKVVGRGVTIIDPHGDLVDFVLREVPEERINEVVLLDLARTDALPILNPLYFGEDKSKIDLTVRDRTIQELVMLMRTRVYHQYTGPRFEELVRLVFETMLDKGYSEPASFVDIPRLLTDIELQSDLKYLLQDRETIKRWQFQSTLARDPEFGGLIHWATSKFADISRDSTLRVVMGGAKPTVNVDEIVNNGMILLVRIPEAVIGKQAADFIGSLILLQLRMAIIRRRQFGKFQNKHFVYVDEFQNFANTDFHTLVAEARKFNIGFTLANQNLEQLREFRTYTGFPEERLMVVALSK